MQPEDQITQTLLDQDQQQQQEQSQNKSQQQQKQSKFKQFIFKYFCCMKPQQHREEENQNTTQEETQDISQYNNQTGDFRSTIDVSVLNNQSTFLHPYQNPAKSTEIYQNGSYTAQGQQTSIYILQSNQNQETTNQANNNTLYGNHSTIFNNSQQDRHSETTNRLSIENQNTPQEETQVKQKYTSIMDSILQQSVADLRSTYDVSVLNNQSTFLNPYQHPANDTEIYQNRSYTAQGQTSIYILQGSQNQETTNQANNYTLYGNHSTTLNNNQQENTHT